MWINHFEENTKGLANARPFDCHSLGKIVHRNSFPVSVFVRPEGRNWALGVNTLPQFMANRDLLSQKSPTLEERTSVTGAKGNSLQTFRM
jgi:hypothetical protein